MSSSGLKKATAFAVDQAQKRKKSSKTGKEKKDSLARADAEKAEGQVLVLNKGEIRALLGKEFGAVLTIKQINEVFKEIKTLLDKKQAGIKWTNNEDRAWASNAANLQQFKTKPGDMVWVVSGFEAAKTAKFKTANEGNDVAGILAAYIKKTLDKDVRAADISAKMQLGHGERGIAASEFGLIRAADEAAEKFNLSSYEKRKLKTVILSQRKRHRLENKVSHSQVWDAKRGTFKKGFRFVLSYQDTEMNAADAERERKAFQDTLQEWDVIGTETSTPTLEGFEEIFFNMVSTETKKSKAKRSSRKAKAKIDEKSQATVVRQQNEQVNKVYKVARGLSTRTLKQAGVKEQKQQKAMSPFSYLAMINKKLPQAVRKNMRAPGLENRSGRFASSVQVRDAVMTKQGYPSFGYTYQKDPYQVFEVGQGKVPWSTSQRDPRKLIDKSIREVAAELALGRFYTRRL
tara:strand:- start:1607 stop:2986 length:1380 start_codon:yes stop_codon:yes gene_type:complete